MISHRYKCIFLHIPKCAGTSIESALGHFEYYTGRRMQDHRTLRILEQPFPTSGIFSSKGNVIEFMRRLRNNFVSVNNPNNKLTVTKAQYDSYFKFTFVRNPWARAFSYYNNVKRDEVLRNRFQIDDDLPLNEFLKAFVGKRLLRSQLHWLKDFKGTIPLDFIGRFECLGDDFEQAMKQAGISNITLPHKIKGSGVDYRQFYDAESIDLIRNYYQEEINLFKYSFDK